METSVGHIVNNLVSKKKRGRWGEEGRGGEVGRGEERRGGGEERRGGWQNWGRGSDGLLCNRLRALVRGDPDGSESCPQCERACMKSHTKDRGRRFPITPVFTTIGGKKNPYVPASLPEGVDVCLQQFVKDKERCRGRSDYRFVVEKVEIVG